MRDLLLELKASSHGEPFRLVATGVRPIGGTALFSTLDTTPAGTSARAKPLSGRVRSEHRNHLELHNRADCLRGEFYPGTAPSLAAWIPLARAWLVLGTELRTAR